MDLSLLPTPVSEDSRQRTGARFTVRSANSPSYSLIRRPGVRKPRGLLDGEKEDAQEVGERERYVMHTGTNGTNKKEDHTVTAYQARIGSRSSVKGQCEEKETSGHKMSTKPNQNDPTDKTVTESGADRSGNCNPASESCGRTDLGSNVLPSRSKSLDWRKGERSPDWVKRADMFTLSTKRGGEVSKWLGGLDERGTGVEGMRGRVMSSVQTYNAAGTSKDVQGRSSVSHMSQPLDRASRGHSLPSRLRSQSGPSSGVRGTTPSFEPNGGQSILERIEKLFEVRNALVRECMAEFLGTFVLLLFGCSASAQVKTSRETKGQFLSVNMAFSVGVMSAMYLTKGITGAHLNPAVTLSFCVFGQARWGRLVPYCLSQLLGAYMASGLVYLVYYDAIMAFSGGVLTVYGPNETASIFATYPSEYITMGRSFLDQVVGTGMLMLCILCLNEKRNTPAPSELIPVIVAVIVLGISMSMSANCGAAINPARDLGPRLFTLTAGWGVEVFTCYNYWFWVPLVAPPLGAVIGTLMYKIFIDWQLPDPDQPDSLSILSTITDKIKQPSTVSNIELKAAHL
ncbi:aquaporin-10a isoform X2 [Chaetodon auriga]|uniref:aquaporin-10a isoform X2 n=1 Tax=Chaetodon auriga TaxID=39042 RepID=UPI004032990F